MTPRQGGAGALLRRLALAAFLLSLLADLPPMAVRALRRVGRATLELGEDARGARVRVMGTATVAAFDSLRRAIPAGGDYWLVDGGEADQAATYWTRFELAPRRAIFVGRLREMEGMPRRMWEPPAASRWVVVANPAGPPRLLTPNELVELTAGKHGPR